MHGSGRALIATALIALCGVARADDPTPDAGVPPDAPAPPPADAPAPPPEAAAPIKVSGRVIDDKGKPVKGATVKVENSTATTTTDAKGRFTIDAPVGATLVITSEKLGAGLASVTGAALEDTVLLQDVANEEIEVSGEAPISSTGTAQLNREELQRIPGTGGDVVRALNAMPGVVNVQIPLGYSGVVIRGASPQDSRFLIDDFEVPVLFHPFGLRAIVPTESIQSLTYVPGSFDVAYGRSSSGIVLLTSRPGSDTRSTQAEVSLVDGGLIAQGPIGKDTRYMFGLRRSVIDFVLPAIIPDTVDLSLTTVPQYWDEQLRIDYKLDSKWDLSVSSVGTDDVFELYTTKDEDAKTKRFYSRTRFIRLTPAARYHEGEWTTTLALSGMVQELDAEIGLYQRLIVQNPQVTPRATVTRTSSEAAGLRDVVWSSGAEAQIGYSDVDMAIPLERREGEPYPPYDPKDTATHFMGSVWVHDYAAWTSLAASFTPRIRLTNGVRLEYFGRPRETAIQPRAEMQLRLTDQLTSRFGAGFYRRPPEFQSEFLQKDVKSERATQTTMGVEYTPIPGLRLQGSLYYTDRTALITHNPDGTLGNNGRGTSKGAELLAMLYTGEWFGWVGYSYSHSVRVDEIGGPERLFDYDQPHSLNIAGSWKRGRWQLGARFNLYSGLPYTPVVGAELDSDRNLFIPTPGPVNSERAPLHHQVDIRVDYSWKWGPTQLLAFLDIQNVYLNRTVVTYFYSYDYSQRSAFETLPLIPSIGLRGTF